MVPIFQYFVIILLSRIAATITCNFSFAPYACNSGKRRLAKREGILRLPRWVSLWRWSGVEGRQRPEEAAGGETEDRRAAGHRTAHQGASPLGQLPVDRQWRPPSGETHRRQAGPPAVAAEAPPSLRALDRGARRGLSDHQRDGQDRA